MKRLLLLIALLTFGTSSLQAQAPVKKVLLEEFTGSWCGWCPRGIWEIQQLEAQYPDQFISVAFHNGDPMITTEGNTLQATVTGYPDAWFDRLVQTDGTRNTDPTGWANMMDSRLNDPVIATVAVKNVSYNPLTRAVSGDVTVNFLVDTAGDIRLNMYVVEDSVSGPAGTTWDQHNYLTNRAGYEDNPFFKLPAVVPGYQHMHVVRAVLGGAWGMTGVVPATVTKGSSYTTTFTYTLPTNMKPDQCRLVGLAAQYSTTIKKNVVYNADQVRLTNLPLITGFSASTPKQYDIAARSAQTLEVITLTNSGSEDLTVSVAANTANSSIPSGWTATVTTASVKVPAKSSALDTIVITAPAKAAFVGVSVDVLPISDTRVAHMTPINVSALSAGTKYVQFGTDVAIPARLGTAYSSDFATLPLDRDVMKAYPPESFDVGIFPQVSVLDFDPAVVTGGAPILTEVYKMLAAGKKALITSQWALYYAFDAASQYSSIEGTEGLANFVNDLGISYNSIVSHWNAAGTAVTGSSKLLGYAGDVVGDGIKGTVKNAYYDSFTFQSNQATPIFYFAPTSSEDSVVAGIRLDKGSGQRMVYLDFNLGDISVASVASSVLNKSMDYLVNGVNAVEPGTQVATTLSNNPNPVSSETKINYSVSDRTPVSITVHDVLGREVAHVVNATQDAGSYSVNFDASKLPSGSYTYILNAGGKTIEKTMTVTK